MGRKQSQISETQSKIGPKSIQNESWGGLQNGPLAAMKKQSSGKTRKMGAPRGEKERKIPLFRGLFGVIIGVFLESPFYIKKT